MKHYQRQFGGTPFCSRKELVWWFTQENSSQLSSGEDYIFKTEKDTSHPFFIGKISRDAWMLFQTLECALFISFTISNFCTYCNVNTITIQIMGGNFKIKVLVRSIAIKTIKAFIECYFVPATEIDLRMQQWIGRCLQFFLSGCQHTL